MIRNTSFGGANQIVLESLQSDWTLLSDSCSGMLDRNFKYNVTGHPKTLNYKLSLE